MLLNVVLCHIRREIQAFCEFNNNEIYKEIINCEGCKITLSKTYLYYSDHNEYIYIVFYF